MSHSAPLELLTDAAGSVTFGWMEDGVYYARFSHCLSAKLGEAFAARLRSAAQTAPIKYFADCSALESYDLLARSAFVRVVTEQRRRFEHISLLAWSGSEVNRVIVDALHVPTDVTKDPIEFEARLFALAPRARYRLGARSDLRSRPRSPLRR